MAAGANAANAANRFRGMATAANRFRGMANTESQSGRSTEAVTYARSVGATYVCSAGTRIYARSA